MFELEQSIAVWRNQMVEAGIENANVLDELEEHLREEMQQQLQTGLGHQAAFDMAARQIGQTDALKPEFAKVGETVYEKLQQLFNALAGIPKYQLVTNMNNASQNIEPRWATYLKSAAYIFPAFFLWCGSCVFIIPKLKEIGAASRMRVPEWIVTALNVSDFIRFNFILIMVVTLGTLLFLEWRSSRWPRYRRLVFGITAFSFNFLAIIFATILLVFAVAAGASLLPK